MILMLNLVHPLAVRAWRRRTLAGPASRACTRLLRSVLPSRPGATQPAPPCR
ncbi:hypothetical protein FA95DRAFT_1552485, partial [Auriscalpium vulgare]